MFKVFCNKCGKPVRPGGSFCHACGAPVEKREPKSPPFCVKPAFLVPVSLLLAAGIALLVIFVFLPLVRGPRIDVERVSDVLEDVGPEILDVKAENGNLEVEFLQPDCCTYDLAIVYLTLFDLAQYAAPETENITLVNVSEGVPLIRTTASSKKTEAWRDGEIDSREFIDSLEAEPSAKFSDQAKETTP